MARERLSKYDAIFYYTSNRRVVMQASAGILVDGPIDFDRYIAWLSPRIERMPKLRMMLKPAPLALRLPAWEPVDEFDLGAHVTSHRIDTPGNDEQLRTLFTELLHQRLRPDKPLWRLHVINGLEQARAALLLCWHHCMADAEGVFEMFRILFETTNAGATPPNRVSKAGLTRQAHAQRPLHGLRAMLSPDGRRRLATMVRYARTPGPSFPFTRPVSGKMNIAWRQIPLRDIRTIRKAFGGTVTDIILTTLGGAMDSYAAEHNIPVRGTFLRLQVPANVRMPNKYGELGNEITMLPGVVPLGIADPVERLRRVAGYNRTLKELDMASMIHGMMGAVFGFATPPGQALLCRTMASKPFLHMARVTGLPPQEHALISSVVLPPVTYSIDGQRITAFLNFLPGQFNMGFVSSPVTYGDTVTLTLSADAENLGDAESVMDDAVIGIEELRGLAG